MRSGQTYYYDVDGSQVALQPASHLAVDLKAAATAELPGDIIDTLRENGRLLREEVVLLDREKLSGDVEKALDAAGALQPVFLAEDGVLLVVLPEVRVEATDAQEASKVRQCVESADVEAEVIGHSGERLIVRPNSGRGADALYLANRIEEEVHPPMAQARVLRIVPRPGVRHRRGSRQRLTARQPGKR